MPKFKVEKSICIATSIDKVYPLVRDLREWARWSPWVLAEPECPLEYSDDGLSYSWDGEIIGSGRLEIVEETPNEAIHFKLTFLKPWKSESATSFYFQESSEGIDAKWDMVGSLPFFLFWMKNSMVAMVGMDYNRGLLMLKDLAETGSVPSKCDFLGLQALDEMRYVGLERECSISEIGARMPEDLERLNALLGEQGVKAAGNPLAFYHKYQVTRGQVCYSVAVPVDEEPGIDSDGLKTGVVPQSSAYVIKHVGAYRHLGNAWAAGMIHARSKKFKSGKQFPPFESYENDPCVVAEEALETKVFFPVK